MRNIRELTRILKNLFVKSWMHLLAFFTDSWSFSLSHFENFCCLAQVFAFYATLLWTISLSLYFYLQLLSGHTYTSDVDSHSSKPKPINGSFPHFLVFINDHL